jgi:hypothetical protein
VETCGAASEEAIPEPITPGRTERTASTGQRLGCAAEGGGQERASPLSSYHSLYEEANQLLKNLHFERLLRHVPPSPDKSDSKHQGVLPDS